jgi:putative transposase
MYRTQPRARGYRTSGRGDYTWSSARVHCGVETCPPWLAMQPWAAVYRPTEWEEVLTIGFRDHGQLERLRDALRSGRPVGDDAFVDELEAKLGKPLRPQKTGRPAKQ